jgi:DNA polymerase
LLRDWQLAGLTHLPRRPRTSSLPDGAVDQPDSGATLHDSAAVPAARRQLETPDHSALQDSMPKRTSSPPPATVPARQAPNQKRNTASKAARAEQLEVLSACVAKCRRCPQLARTRTQTVFGAGDPRAKVMFIGEAPGADEDRTGVPFVGRAGQLLTKIIEACGWTREELYICNILRCRPPENRTPSEEEASNCREYLDGQIAIVDPDYIVCWGSCAAQNLLDSREAIGKMRQRFYQYGRAQVLCTYHPSYLLRNPAAKKPVWEDMKLLLKTMGLTPPAP